MDNKVVKNDLKIKKFCICFAVDRGNKLAFASLGNKGLTVAPPIQVKQKRPH